MGQFLRGHVLMPTSGENDFCRYLIGRSSGGLEVQENMYRINDELQFIQTLSFVSIFK